MAKSTVGGAVTEGIMRAGGVHSAAGLGIRLSDRGISLGTSKAVSSAVSRMSKIRQKAGGVTTETTIVWNGEKLEKILHAQMSTRLKLASQLVKDQCKRNLSKPVLKYKGPISKRTRVLPESRSKRGEYPRLETARLMRDIFNELVSPDRAVVGTTLGYGLLLETKMERSFLRRTLLEMQPRIRQILVKTVSL